MFDQVIMLEDNGDQALNYEDNRDLRYQYDVLVKNMETISVE